MPDTTPPQTEPPQSEVPHGIPTGRAMHIVYICAVAATVVGLYFGIRYEPERATQDQQGLSTHDQATHAPAASIHPAINYKDIHRGSLGPNADWHTRHAYRQAHDKRYTSSY